MQQITKEQAKTFSATHFSFTEANILYQTNKAYSVKVWNNRIEQITSQWVPKKVVKFTVTETPNGTFRTFYAPKYFIK